MFIQRNLQGVSAPTQVWVGCVELAKRNTRQNQDLRRSRVVKTIYDPACGTGGMLSVSEKYLCALNAEANPLFFGRDWNDEAWAVCKSDMLSKMRAPKDGGSRIGIVFNGSPLFTGDAGSGSGALGGEADKTHWNNSLRLGRTT